MNLCLFFEGTGQGVAGNVTNVTRLRDICIDDARQKLHLEPGPGTHFGAYLGGRIAGSDWQAVFRSARRWLEANYETLPKDGVATNVFLFGFSRGALIARHFAAWLDKLGVDIAQRLDTSAVVLHDSHTLVSNLWGAFDRVRRDISGLRLHRLCRGLAPTGATTEADRACRIACGDLRHLHRART